MTTMSRLPAARPRPSNRAAPQTLPAIGVAALLVLGLMGAGLAMQLVLRLYPV